MCLVSSILNQSCVSVPHFRWRGALAAFVGENESFFAVRRIRTEHYHGHIAFDIFKKGRRDGATVPLTHLVAQQVVHCNVVIPEENHKRQVNNAINGHWE